MDEKVYILEYMFIDAVHSDLFGSNWKTVKPAPILFVEAVKNLHICKAIHGDIISLRIRNIEKDTILPEEFL